ncbi:hypothetical protein KCP74_23560 [Salmonella enterica subsp. enterica]|nr:hypothetical protein KCP74_23560 [Salmonella enterica subsp. enterica]
MRGRDRVKRHPPPRRLAGKVRGVSPAAASGRQNQSWGNYAALTSRRRCWHPVARERR